MNMKRIFGVALAVLAIVVTTAAVNLQRPDLAASLFPATSVAPVRSLNTAIQGTAVDIANYGSAMLLVQKGHIRDTVSAPRYVVLADSNAGAAIGLVDSVLLDTVDTQIAKIAYRGNRRFLKAIVRAGGVALDTAFVSVSVIRGNARSR